MKRKTIVFRPHQDPLGVTLGRRGCWRKQSQFDPDRRRDLMHDREGRPFCELDWGEF